MDYLDRNPAWSAVVGVVAEDFDPRAFWTEGYPLMQTQDCAFWAGEDCQYFFLDADAVVRGQQEAHYTSGGSALHVSDYEDGQRIGLLLDTIAGSLALFIDEEKVKCWEEMGMTGSFRWAVIMHGVEEEVIMQGSDIPTVCSGAGSVTIGAEKDAHRRVAQRLEANRAFGLQVGLRARHRLDDRAHRDGRRAAKGRRWRRRGALHLDGQTHWYDFFLLRLRHGWRIDFH